MIFHEAHLIGALKARTPPIKTALLDPADRAGLGNSLCLAKHFTARAIHTRRVKAGRISAARVGGLVPINPPTFLNVSITAGGNRPYAISKRAERKSWGYFQHALTCTGARPQACRPKLPTSDSARIVQLRALFLLLPACQR